LLSSPGGPFIEALIREIGLSGWRPASPFGIHLNAPPDTSGFRSWLRLDLTNVERHQARVKIGVEF
jgi:hypothetical protein